MRWSRSTVTAGGACWSSRVRGVTNSTGGRGPSHRRGGGGRGGGAGGGPRAPRGRGRGGGGGGGAAPPGRGGPPPPGGPAAAGAGGGGGGGGRNPARPGRGGPPPPVDPGPLVERLEQVVVGDRLGRAQEQGPALPQPEVEQGQHPLLDVRLQVDQQVP